MSGSTLYSVLQERGTVQKEVSPASVLPLVETNGTTSGSKLLSLDLENNASGVSTSNGNKKLQTNICKASSLVVSTTTIF